MNCHEAEWDMVFSFYGDLDDDARRALEDHCRSCPSCVRTRAEMKADLEEFTRLSGALPEFDWDRSWRAIREGLAGQARARSRRSFVVGRLLPAAALGILVLGIVIGPRVFKSTSPSEADGRILARLLQQHLGEAEIALREVANIDAEQGSRLVLSFEQERTRSLGFRNRTMRTMARTSSDPDLSRLLSDLEIILYETANLDPASAEAVKRTKALIRDKEILFRIRHLKGAFDPPSGRKEVL